MGHSCPGINHLLSFGIICLLTGLTNANNNDQITFQCPLGWKNINYKCYKVINLSVPWDVASAYCKSMQSELVKIPDSCTNKEVSNEASTKGISEFWIGFTLLNAPPLSEDAYWSSGEKTNIRRGYWADYNPNLAGKCSYEIHTSKGPKWALGNCDEKKEFVCEKAACTVGTFMCSNSRCIGQNQICDDNDDCLDGSDERNCPQHCRYYYTGTSGTFNTAYFPQTYNKNSFCLWSIQADLGTSINLMFTDFQTEANTDVVEIFVGSLSESDAFLKYRLSGDNIAQVNYSSPNNLMLVKFTSDSTIEYKGFKAKWTTVSPSLKSSELLASPSGNLTVYDYNNNAQNMFTIRTTKNREIITLEKMHMVLWDNDEVVVFDGASLTSPVLATYKNSGTELMGPRFVQSTGEAMMILLKSRGLFSDGGFSFSYLQGCVIEIKDQLSGEVMSPGYSLGKNYANSLDCKWYIDIPTNHSYMLKFSSNYDIDTPDDVLYVYNMVNSRSVLLFNSTSAASAPTDLKITTGAVQIIFKTNSVVNKIGFKADFSIDCSDPNFNPNTLTPVGSTWHYGSSFNVSCKPGYSFYSEEFAASGSTNVSFVSQDYVEMICLKGGQWNIKTIPQCLQNYCGPVKPVQNGRVTNATGVRAGDEALYTCTDGYTTIGKNPIKCLDNGQWETPPVCTATGCSSLSNLTNGQLNITEGTGTSVGSIAIYTCNAGYEIDGAPISQCQKSGDWSSQPPTCKILQCPGFGIDGEISNAKIQPLGDVDVGQNKTVTCNDGYSLNGISPIVCLDNQTFVDLPTCQDIDECSPSSNLSQCNQICVNTPGSYYCKCRKGFLMQGDNVTCIDIDECQSNNSDCEQICTNTQGGYECDCNKGFVLYTQNYTMNYALPTGENGKSSGDVFYFNHSCVPVLCPNFANIVNGYIQPQRKFSHFGDTFYFSCEIGFQLTGVSSAVCLSNGTWSATLPTCQAISCSYNVSHSVPYLGFYNFSCEVPGKPKEHRQRQCLFDPITNSYKLLGDSYVCKEIDCGQPKVIPGALALNITNTTYDSQYEIKCSDLYRPKGNTSYGFVIYCGSDGKWNYGDIKCYGALCDFPPVPPDGTVDVTGFTEGSVATYNCTKEGYVPFNVTQRICVKNASRTGLIWNQNLPKCVDSQAPTAKNGTCNELITLNKYSALNITPPIFTDNSGVFTMTIEPKEAITGFIVSTDMVIIYTAIDATGNRISCTKTIVVEDRQLQIICPQYLIAELENVNETKLVTFNSSIVTVRGAGATNTITFMPSELNLTQENIDEMKPVVAEVYDGKSKVNCTFYLSVQAKTCSALSRPDVQYASWSYTGNQNLFTCSAGYSYPEEILKTKMTAVCSSSWNVPYTSCSKLDTYAKFYGDVLFIYKADTSTFTDQCVDEMGSALVTGMELLIKNTTCDAVGNNPRLKPIRSSFKNSRNATTISISGLMEILQTTQPTNSVNEACFGIFKSYVQSTVFNLYQFISRITSTCGTLQFDSVVTNTEFVCPNTTKTVTLNDYTYCVHCPPGSYYEFSNGNVNYKLCPLGEYQDFENQVSCKKCPEGTSTYSPGGYNITLCKPKCAAGFYSVLGIPPCKNCPADTYSVNATYCQTCPVGTKGRQLAAVSKDSCKDPCKPGTYSYDGFEPCHPCPKGFYNELQMQARCLECNIKTTTSAVGADNKALCLDVAQLLCNPNPCNNGQCVPIRHLFTCNCSQGFTGARCNEAVDPCSSNPCYYGGTCSIDGSGYKCNCPLGTNGQNCETILQTCTQDTCKNNGICRNIINNSKCYCLSGYAGEFCQNVSLPCEQNPCQNGICSNLGTENYKCDCTLGYEGNNCDTLIDNCASSPCLFNGKCINSVNDFSCNCSSGYSGKTCSQRESLCPNVNCTMGTCVPNVLGESYTCSCDVGYTYGDYCQFSLKTSNASNTGFYKQSESNSSAPCVTECLKNTSCKTVAYNDISKTCYFYNTETEACCKVFTKQCQKPTDNFWTPWYSIMGSTVPEVVRGQLKNEGINVCDGKLTSVTQCKMDTVVDDKMRPDKNSISVDLRNPCLVDKLNCNSGTENECSMYQIRFQCAINEAIQNNQCKKLSYCEYTHCENGGTCSEFLGTCICSIYYNQPYCRVKKDFCLTKSCGNGTCINENNQAVCKCNPGFEGSPCTNINDCQGNPCDTNGTATTGCQDLVNGYYCPCKAGYKGKNCTENINECLSNPCFHNGICIDQINDFTCKCPDGWTGKRCEKLVDYCNINQCSENGVCINLYKNYYCRCPPNTYGQNCSQSVSICKDANPCINYVNCTEYGGKAMCTCKQGFTGVGCEIAIEFCKTTVCANGGTCAQENNTYKCHCPTGFKGLHCEENTNTCETSLVTCQEPTPTVCPLGKTGNNCNKDVSSNYDLDFYLYERNGMATMKSAVIVPNTNFSISLWVRFNELNGQGTFLNLFMIKSDGIFKEKHPVLRLSDKGITYTAKNGMEVMLKTKTLMMNDGKWNLFMMTVFDSGNSMELRLNNFADFEQVTEPIINFFGQKCLVILGCYYDAQENMPVVNKGFYGELSQVKLYNRYLDFKTDIPQLTLNPTVDLNGIVFGWGNYILNRGVRKIVPSAVNGSAPSVGQTAIGINSCPKMINNYGSQGRTLLQWNPPQFTDNTELKENYRPGTTVMWGCYAVTYEAKDARNNVALCNFKVYAKEKNCTKPQNPHEGTADCTDQQFPYYSCKITCNNNRAVVMPAPLLFTCGPTGEWHPDQPYMPMRLPSCGVIKSTATSLSLNLEYSIQSVTCKDAINALGPKPKETLKILNTQNGLILCQLADCLDVKWTFSCDSRFNAIQDLKVNAILNPKNSSASDILTKSVLDDKDFDYPSLVAGGTLLTDRFSISPSNSCGVGEALMQGQCVECTPGTFLNISTQCDFCPVASYQTNVAQTNCTPCPVNHTTLGTGHMNITSCKIICPAGEYFNMNTNACTKCDILSYQGLEGQFSCKPCMFGKSTKSEGATSESECTETCPAGYEFTTNCTECQIGFYREKDAANTCKKCSNNTITLSTGSTSELQCNISACFAGSYLNEANNTCILCAEDQYQNEINEKSCKPCPSGSYKTGKRGAQKLDDCKFFCESGFQANNKTCEPCPKGTYKDNNEDFQSLCKPCPISKTTVGTNSTSQSDCNIYKCPAGQQPNSTQNGCEPCPLGMYQPETDQKECIKCNANYSTRTNGSINPNSCEVFCDSGYEKVSGQASLCKACEIGYFKDNSRGVFTVCQLCSNGAITEMNASISELNCTKANCSAGQYLNTGLNQCFECDYGFYQNEKWQTSCNKCATNYTTYNKGADNESLCLPLCAAGYGLSNRECKPCPIGYYRGDLSQMNCSVCPDRRYVTAAEGATSAQQCTVANCSAGFYSAPNNTCQECPLNQYQNVSLQTQCLPCPSGFKTWKTGSTSCVPVCPAGEILKIGTCTKCQRGYYRTTSMENCMQCPKKFLTEQEGAQNSSFCTIPPCNSGEFYNGNDCQKCPKNSYQDKKHQRSCMTCPDGKYTTMVGSTQLSSCLSYCTTNKDNCSANSTCLDAVGGFKCECKKNYIKTASKCTHICDTNYCLNGATCSRGITSVCVCSKYYDGLRCDRKLSAKEVSKDTTRVIIGAVVGVLAGILIIILIVTYICVRMRRNTQHPSLLQRDSPSFAGSLSTKFAPSYMPVRSLAAQSAMDPDPQVNAYTNAAYDEDSDPAILKL